MPLQPAGPCGAVRPALSCTNSGSDVAPSRSTPRGGRTPKAVASSDAIGAVMLTQIRHELDTGALCLLPVHTPWLRLNYGFIRRDSAVSAGALEFMAAFRERETALNCRRPSCSAASTGGTLRRREAGA